MLELYHSVTAVCAQKVRIAMAEKGLRRTEHVLTLRGDQNSPEYLEKNPNAVVPTLVHDGVPIIESSLILYYLDEAFPEKPLMPTDPKLRHQARMFNRMIDDYIHLACTIITFATSLRPTFANMPPEFWQSPGQQTPAKRREMAAKRGALESGIESEFVRDSIAHYQRLFSEMEGALTTQPYLAGADFSLAECGVFPYFLRLELLNLSGLWAKHAAVSDWYRRMRERPGVRGETLDRMGEQEWVPYSNLSPDPWPQVARLLEA